MPASITLKRRNPLAHPTIWFLLLACSLLPPSPGSAQTPRGASLDTAVSPLPSATQFAAKLAELDATTGMDESLKSSLTENYRRAQSNLEDAANFDAKASEFARSLKTAPRETDATLAELERLKTRTRSPADDLPKTLDTEEIQQRQNKVMADVALEEARASEFEKMADTISSRPTTARQRLIEVKQTLDQIEDELKQPPVSDESPELAQARRWVVETQRKTLWSEGKMLEQELLSQPVREALFKAKRDLASQKLEDFKARQRQLEEMQSKRRQAAAEAAQQASEQAQREAEDKHPLVRSLTQQNAEISDSLSSLTKGLDGFSAKLANIEAERKRIEEDFRGAKQRLEAVGLSKALGQVLLDRRNQLPDLRQYRDDIESREDQIADATLSQIRYREEERQLRDLDRYIRELTAHEKSAQQPLVRKQLRETLTQRKRLIGQALDIEEDYIRQLGELNYAAEQVIMIATNYDDFLAERLLWVRSSPAVGLDTLINLPAAIAWLVSPDGWTEIARTLTERNRHAFLFWLGIGGSLLLYWRVPSLKRRIRGLSEPLRRIRTDRFRYTLQAIGLSLLASLPLPLLSWSLGQQLVSSASSTPFARDFGTAFTEVAFGLYCLLAFRMLCMNGGVADRHFRWSGENLQRIRRHFNWFSIFIIPVSLIAVAVSNHNDPAYNSSLARLALIADMIGFAVFYGLLLSPERGILKSLIDEHPEGWINRLRHIWRPLIVGSPLALAALALFGYVYTAVILFQSLVYQTWFALGLILLHQSIVRWLILTRRRLALQAALERQAARRAQAETERPESSPASEVQGFEEPEPDLAALDEQTRRLINASVFIGALMGLWLAWSDVLPAFNLFERIELWHYSGVINGTERLIPVTAADVGLVMVIIFVATIAAKNLPALLEIMLLQNSAVSAGARYAIKTLSSYSITAIAFLLVFSTLGLSWSQVQWLVAALSVGIGFGLQEIVANFISGLIILFERPVRVGDIVTIDGTTGVVTNIRIRATTIRNWDKQELLVPNKEFITGRLLNWSLTDQQNRITIPVGVEYGCDTKKALAILTQIADEHEQVLKDPAPLVSFESFGDNALTLFMRCYLNSLDGRIGIISDLHQAIYDRFNAAGIGIAFPQRDVHLSTNSPLEIRLQRARRQDMNTTEQATT
ncbi:mechanosensitive ion channel domain-containing protein [Imhoffiella purpurea]|uniref:Potassium efflux system KefA protein n=1 Tax=Imhoffiella purpurea TaxID=1249627 RepID=W9VDZ4_9GAMM|nr:mechanosensitive ion channel domain-containing protein [Imhoffiella purpurea]EXJ15216.1 Potassium efflux system KefA protein [Imhoffiella purpurea]